MKKLLSVCISLCLLASGSAFAGEYDVLYESALGYTMTYDPGWVVPADGEAITGAMDVFTMAQEDPDWPGTVRMTVELIETADYTLEMAAAEAEASMRDACDAVEMLDTGLMFDGAPSAGFIGIDNQSLLVTEMFIVTGERCVYRLTLTYHVEYENGIGAALHQIAATFVPGE